MKEEVSLNSIIRIEEKEENTKYRIDKKLKIVEGVWNEFLQLLIQHKIPIPKFPIWTDWWDGDGVDTRVTKENPKLSKKENKEQIDKKIKSFLQKYEKWIEKNRKFWEENKEILSPWLMRSRNFPEWNGAVRKFEWQASDLNAKGQGLGDACFSTAETWNSAVRRDENDALAVSMFRVLWTPRSSGIRVKRLNYSPTLVAMTNIPIYGPESRHFTPRELLRLQSFPETFIPHEKKNVSYNQIGNSVHVLMIKNALKLLLS